MGIPTLQWMRSCGIDPRLYGAWAELRRRCFSPKNHAYDRYGGRGITVCRRWTQSYHHFAADMGPHPGKGWTLDRKNNDGNYCKRNCRWATYDTQAQNRRSTKLNTRQVDVIRKLYATGRYRQIDLAVRFKVGQSQISDVIKNKRWAPTTQLEDATAQRDTI